jgi:hypothetical protein
MIDKLETEQKNVKPSELNLSSKASKKYLKKA